MLRVKAWVRLHINQNIQFQKNYRCIAFFIFSLFFFFVLSVSFTDLYTDVIANLRESSSHMCTNEMLPRGQRHSSKPFASEEAQETKGCRYQCRSCGKTYAHSFSMLRHRRLCEGSCHLECPVCGKPYHRRDLYSIHLNLVHNILDTR